MQLVLYFLFQEEPESEDKMQQELKGTKSFQQLKRSVLYYCSNSNLKRQLINVTQIISVLL